MKNENKDISEKIRSMHPGTTLNIKLSIYHLNEIYITGRGVVRRMELEMQKEENFPYSSFYDARRITWVRILDEIENTINKE